MNRATGGIEIRDEAALDESLSTMTAASPPAAGPIFMGVADKDLTRLGVDEKTLTFARALTDVTQLEAAQAFLPAIQWEVLYGLAAGMTPEEVWSDLGATILDEPVDTDDIDAAVRRSRDRVVLVDGPDELMAVFANPFALWRIYLHPTQQSLFATFRGPARVTGGPGTGKTVVALHRAQRLALRAEGKVLVTTFTSTLADTLQTGVTLPVENSSIVSRIVVQHVDRVARTHETVRREATVLLDPALTNHTDTLSSTRYKISAPTSGVCSAPQSPKAKTICFLPVTPTSESTIITQVCGKSESMSPGARASCPSTTGPAPRYSHGAWV